MTSALWLAPMSARAVYGKYIGYAVGLDLEAGAAAPLGFAYGARLFPLGVGVMLTPTGYLGVFSGVGAVSTIVGFQDFTTSYAP